MGTPADADQLASLSAVIDGWLDEELATNPAVLAVERDVEGPGTWYVRLGGEAKEYSGVLFRLGQRTLRFETYFMPAPEENQAQLYEHLLRRNGSLYGASFVIGDEDAIYLQGRLDHALVTPDELDRILGSLYAWVEQCFLPALKIGFASRFA